MTSRPAAPRLITAASLTAAAALVLAACGGSGPPVAGGQGGDEAPSQSDDVVYDFEEVKQNSSVDEETPFIANDKTVRVRPSDELLAALPDGKSLLVDELTLTPKAFGTGSCRLDVGIVYAKGGEQTLKTADTEKGPQSTLVGALTGVSLQDDESQDQVVDSVPGDDDVRTGGRYVTEDLKNITFVDDCGGDPDDDDLVSLDLPYMQDLEEEFAWVEVSVMDDGQNGGEGTTIAILGSADAEVSPSGKWLKPED